MRLILLAIALSLILEVRSPAAEPALTARAAFALLKKLAGEWSGPVGNPGGEVGKVNFRVTSGGSAVFEHQFPGTPHEMTSVYHLDGEELVLTHYCAVGNQPRMKLDRARSTAQELVFEFQGGANLDPARDGHVHAGRIRLVGEGRFDAEWYFHANGRLAGTNGFYMKRVGS